MVSYSYSSHAPVLRLWMCLYYFPISGQYIKERVHGKKKEKGANGSLGKWERLASIDIFVTTLYTLRRRRYCWTASLLLKRVDNILEGPTTSTLMQCIHKSKATERKKHLWKLSRMETHTHTQKVESSGTSCLITAFTWLCMSHVRRRRY